MIVPALRPTGKRSQSIIINCGAASNGVTAEAMTDPELPQYSHSEQVADGIVHVISIGAAVIGAIMLFMLTAGSLPAVSIASLTVYGIGLVAVFCASAAYNMAGVSPLKPLLKRLDQATIYFKIASTYTPFMAIKLAGWTGGGFLALVWSVATFGMTTKLFFPHRLKRASFALYLVLGWCAVLIFLPLFGVLSTRTLSLLFVGGLLYTVGVVFHRWDGLRYQNAIWHGFVLGGAGCHYAAIMASVVLV